MLFRSGGTNERLALVVETGTGHSIFPSGRENKQNSRKRGRGRERERERERGRERERERERGRSDWSTETEEERELFGIPKHS